MFIDIVTPQILKSGVHVEGAVLSVRRTRGKDAENQAFSACALAEIGIGKLVLPDK